MIIELFGPPGSGKTTFANALAASLRKSGHVVDLTLSYRPAERPSRSPSFPSGASETWSSPVAQRLCRPLLEMLAISRHPLLLSHSVSAAKRLIRLLPPRNMTTAIRLSQYILRLLHTWSQASTVRHIVVFDQAFVQVVCSLALFAGTADESLMADALKCSPRPDLLIRLDAPTETLASRLKDRRQGQSPLERLLELDLTMDLHSIRIIDRLHDLLVRYGQPVMSASSLDECSLRESVECVEKLLVAMFSAKHRVTTSPKWPFEVHGAPIAYEHARYGSWPH
jgi:RecA/RadA recombinase